MSWFAYGSLTEKREKIGVWLRVGSNDKLVKSLRKSGRLRFNESIWRIEITEVRKDKEVGLEVWCRKLTFGSITRVFSNNYKPTRYVVFHVWEKEDSEWVCEGDLGRGLKLLKKK